MKDLEKCSKAELKEILNECIAAFEFIVNHNINDVPTEYKHSYAYAYGTVKGQADAIMTRFEK